MDKHMEVLMSNHDLQASPITAQMFGRAGIEHMDKYGKSVFKCPAAESRRSLSFYPVCGLCVLTLHTKCVGLRTKAVHIMQGFENCDDLHNPQSVINSIEEYDSFGVSWTSSPGYLDPSSGVVSSRVWVRLLVIALVPLSKALDHNCFVRS